MQPDCLIVFLRAPVHGQVKTRLARALGADRALELYRCFVNDTLDKVGQRPFDLKIGYCPAQACQAIQAWLGPAYALFPQAGADLGQKMAHAFEHVFQQGYQRACLLGTDLPDLPVAIIDQAFERLANHDAVLGPSSDGGYYLIGFRAATYLPAIFHQMPWGGDGVLARTLAVFAQHRAKLHRLPHWHDIDELQDLIAFWRRNCQRAPASHTRACLKRWHFEHLTGVLQSGKGL